MKSIALGLPTCHASSCCIAPNCDTRTYTCDNVKRRNNPVFFVIFAVCFTKLHSGVLSRKTILYHVILKAFVEVNVPGCFDEVEIVIPPFLHAVSGVNPFTMCKLVAKSP